MHSLRLRQEMTPGILSETAIPPSISPQTYKKERLVSLDAFRGATIALMVLVNNAGDSKHVYHPFAHARWNGWTITDTVFPSFLWIVGVAITLSLRNRLDARVSRSKLFGQIARRAVLLYLLGLLIYAFPMFDLSTQRILGVLQRIAICYLIGSAIYLKTTWKGQTIWIIGLLSAYWLMMKLIAVPGYGAGHLDVENNFAHYVDQIVLGRHNYRLTKTWDPEGIVSTLPAIATTLFGVIAGGVLRLSRVLSERVTWLFVLGSLLITLGLFCDMWLPINKRLWTTSFCLFMAGLDFLVFAIFAWFIDGLGYRRIVRPFVVMGMNAITIYVLSELFSEALDAIHWNTGTRSISLQEWIYAHGFAPLVTPYNASLLYAIAFTMVMYLIAYAMYRRKWFLKV